MSSWSFRHLVSEHILFLFKTIIKFIFSKKQKNLIHQAFNKLNKILSDQTKLDELEMKHYSFQEEDDCYEIFSDSDSSSSNSHSSLILAISAVPNQANLDENTASIEYALRHTLNIGA